MYSRLIFINLPRYRYFSLTDHAHKLRELVDNIFEAEDAAPANIRERDISGTEFFSRTIKTEDGSSRLVLSASTLEKLANSLLKALPRSSRKRAGVQATASDLNVGGTVATPMISTTKSSAKHYTAEGLKGWEDEDIARLFRMLKRSMLDAETVIVFPDDQFDMRKAESAASAAAGTPSPTKGGKPAKKKPKAISPSKNKVARVDFDPSKVADLQHALEKLGEGVSAAGVCLSLLATGELPKQVSRKIISTCLSLPDHSRGTSSIPKTCLSLVWIRSRRRSSMWCYLLLKGFPINKVRFVAIRGFY